MKDRLRAMFCDHLSIMRGKYLPHAKICDNESRFARPVFSVHYDRDLLLEAPGAMTLEGLPDMELRWKGDEIRQGWELATKVVVGDLYAADGQPLPLCPRGALKRAVAAWKGRGLTPKVGIELEAYALVMDENGDLRPYDTPGAVVYGTGPFTDPNGMVDAIWEAADDLGFNIDVITGEYDAPQFEFTLTFDEAVRAVDDIVLFRQMAREVALENGVLLTFMPKPIAGAGGSGLHVNFSFSDAKGHNALSSGEAGGPENMNELARGCVAGLAAHHRALAGLVAPSVNSYARLQPGTLSGYWNNWAGDHRGVTTRVSVEGGERARLEHRMPDASANPYTAVAAILQAALLGVENADPLPPMETGDCFVHQDATDKVADNLTEALDDLEADGALVQAVGQMLVDNHVFMKRAEVEKTAGLQGDALRDFYVHFI